jgi:hypothetical protein
MVHPGEVKDRSRLLGLAKGAFLSRVGTPPKQALQFSASWVSDHVEVVDSAASEVEAIEKHHSATAEEIAVWDLPEPRSLVTRHPFSFLD